ncbi:MAG: hypothetical protein EZS28_029886 [Streblomastix strix]|uniref:Uncharacterized protein n=1 Tax=Streblomastix strix TaxID=222440 RepID=A0A5J4UWB6_9EUKA|nr:MAG: hypothetical protein EZS28_029886 [Streblomastix strix]
MIFDPNLRQQSLEALESFWAGNSELNENDEVLKISSFDYQMLKSSSQDPAISILATFAADLLATSSHEADVERAFSQMNLLLGDQRDRLSNQNIFYSTAIQLLNKQEMQM